MVAGKHCIHSLKISSPAVNIIILDQHTFAICDCFLPAGSWADLAPPSLAVGNVTKEMLKWCSYAAWLKVELLCSVSYFVLGLLLEQLCMIYIIK